MLDTRYRPFLTDLYFIRSMVQKNTEKEKEKHGPITIGNCSFPTDVDAFATDFDFFRRR